MKHIFKLIVLIYIFSGLVNAQTLKFNWYSVDDLPYSIYFPVKPVFEKSYSDDGSPVYTTQTEQYGFTYGLICVQFKENIGDDKEVWKDLITGYISFLNADVFQLKNTVDPGFGHSLTNDSETIGLLQYGETAEKEQYVTKAWINSQGIAILYIHGMSEVEYSLQQTYLNGFSFIY